MKSPVLLPLNKGKKLQLYESQIFDEFLEVMAKTKEEEILENTNSSPCFSVLTDKTSDITYRKHMAVLVKYMKDDKLKVSFDKYCNLSDGKSETIYSELLPIIEGGFKKMSGFTSDGAKAMIGVNEGVATKLKEQKENIIPMNCIDYRLALASKDSFHSQKRYMKLGEILTSTYKYYKYCIVHPELIV